jgi:hypothetical protein
VSIVGKNKSENELAIIRALILADIQVVEVNFINHQHQDRSSDLKIKTKYINCNSAMLLE